jgi:AcrR family transcriptional regulator
MESSSGTQRGPSLRERTRKAVQVEIATQALALFTEQGFDATTVEEIAAAAGISERSFYRYFATKEDVVIGDPAPYGAILQAALEASPTNVAPWDALRSAFGRLLDAVHTDPISSLQASALMLSTPALRARHLEKQTLWETMLVSNIMERLDDTKVERSLQAHAVVSAALSCLDAALNAWALTDGTQSVEDLLDTAIAAVRGR